MRSGGPKGKERLVNRRVMGSCCKLFSLYIDVVLLVFSFHSETSASKQSPTAFIFYHARSRNCEEKIEGLWTRCCWRLLRNVFLSIIRVTYSLLRYQGGLKTKYQISCSLNKRKQKYSKKNWKHSTMHEQRKNANVRNLVWKMMIQVWHGLWGIIPVSNEDSSPGLVSIHRVFPGVYFRLNCSPLQEISSWSSLSGLSSFSSSAREEVLAATPLSLPSITDKSPWDSNEICIFFCHSEFPYRIMHPFQNFLAVLPPPTLYKAETQEKFLIHASNIVCGVRGRG